MGHRPARRSAAPEWPARSRGRAWIALDDHWEWFRRVIEGRKEREGDPVIAILEECLVDVRRLDEGSEAARLEGRLNRCSSSCASSTMPWQAS